MGVLTLNGGSIKRLVFRAQLCKDWGKAASAEIAISEPRAIGVYPFNPGEMPDNAFNEESVVLPSDTPNKLATPCVRSAVDGSNDVSDPSCSSEPRRVLS